MTQTKPELRRAIVAKRNAHSVEDVAKDSAALCENLINFAPLQDNNFRMIAGYISSKQEINPFTAMEALRKHGHSIAIPHVHTNNVMEFKQWKTAPGVALDKATLDGGQYGIPTVDVSAPTVVPDIIIVPLVGFDAAGNRLGYGGGFYDKAIAELHAQKHYPLLIGVGYDWQEVEQSLPNELHDIALDVIITNKAVTAIKL